MPMPECIDLFAGAGGLSIGLRLAGFRTIRAIELDADACKTYSAHAGHPQTSPIPVQDVDFKAFRGIDVVTGGPPCQPFSSGGKRLGSDDSRDMIPEFIRAVAEAKPRTFLLENVPGLVSAARHEYFSDVRRKLRRLGYEISWSVLNAAHYGVPQKRRRLFVVGLLKGEFVFPAPTHGPSCNTPYVPAGKFICRTHVLGDPNPSRVFYAKNPETRPSPFDGHVFNGGGRPIDLGGPCHTILAAAGGNKTHFVDTCGIVPEYHKHLLKCGRPRVGEVEGARRLTVEESALLQTFPRGTEFFGSRSSRYRQVGNAVPPSLAEAVGRMLLRCLQPSLASRVRPRASTALT